MILSPLGPTDNSFDGERWPEVGWGTRPASANHGITGLCGCIHHEYIRATVGVAGLFVSIHQTAL